MQVFTEASGSELRVRTNFLMNENGVQEGWEPHTPGRTCTSHFLTVTMLRRPDRQLASIVDHHVRDIKVRDRTYPSREGAGVCACPRRVHRSLSCRNPYPHRPPPLLLP